MVKRDCGSNSAAEREGRGVASGPEDSAQRARAPGSGLAQGTLWKRAVPERGHGCGPSGWNRVALTEGTGQHQRVGAALRLSGSTMGFSQRRKPRDSPSRVCRVSSGPCAPARPALTLPPIPAPPHHCTAAAFLLSKTQTEGSMSVLSTVTSRL